MPEVQALRPERTQEHPAVRNMVLRSGNEDLPAVYVCRMVMPNESLAGWIEIEPEYGGGSFER